MVWYGFLAAIIGSGLYILHRERVGSDPELEAVA